ncbi:MAG: polysaccharide deacetylase family protein, partial [Alphaproteobacteria bacterium]
MSLRNQVIGTGLSALSMVGVDRWLPKPAGASGFAVTLHHVRGDASGNYDPNGHLSVSPEFLDLFIAQHQAEGWTFVSVDDLVRVGISGRS